MANKRTLTFARHYALTAVYLDGKLHLTECECDASWNLLRALGYECEARRVPEDHEYPKEFSWTSERRWKPPATLAELDRQFAAYQARKRQDSIEYHRGQLAALEAQVP